MNKSKRQTSDRARRDAFLRKIQEIKRKPNSGRQKSSCEPTAHRKHLNRQHIVGSLPTSTDSTS